MYTWPVDRTCLPTIDPVEAPNDVIKLQAAVDTAVHVLWALTGRMYAQETVVARPCPRLNDDGRGVVTLPGPVVQITSVVVDGTEIAPESYHLEGNYLYRTAGGAWPAQDMTIPTGTPGTWSVTYVRGVAPPPGAALAVGQLAKEFWNVCSGTGKCRLPKRWQTIQRQGVTITKADPTDILAQGYTGIPEVDIWVKALNPHQLTQPARVASPDYSSTVI